MILLETMQNVPLTLTEDGLIRVAGTRVALESVVYQYQQGNSAETILESFPSLKLADIHAVISYYLNHRDQLDEYLRDQERQARAVRGDIESDPEYEARIGELRARIKSRSASQHPAK